MSTHSPGNSVQANKRLQGSSFTKRNATIHTHTARTVQITRCALLVAAALALSALETLLPFPAPVPGIKLGLANIVTVLTAFWLGPKCAAAVLFARIILASITTGQLATLPFSFAGGLCALAVVVLFVKQGEHAYIRLCSMVAALAHNIAQLGVALLLTATPELGFYLPFLLIAGLITGFVTGTLAQALIARIPQSINITPPTAAPQSRFHSRQV